ncbi:class IV adenylate cyclase [Kitasatospora sp. NPDC059160]|uniref:class IV adenylate cyclase n=1 Tax=Kitasatospora sp. NPDC059160 TaxID=3346748 RepID=UPI00368B0CEC
MVIEAELKAVVRDPDGVLKRLEERYGAGRAEVYRDTYYDAPDGSLMGADRELRIRTVHGPDGTRSVLTYKGARVDEASGSKPEAETRVEDAEAAHEIVRGLDFVSRIAFEKRCRNTLSAVSPRWPVIPNRTSSPQGLVLDSSFKNVTSNESRC